MIIPYATDAPIYHWPRATLGVIIANVAIYVLSMSVPPETVRPWLMELGTGLHPLQWLTHNFLHADPLHLLFNMVFLWSYGIIVEGKVGWLPFLLTYIAIGICHGAAIQAAYSSVETTSYVLGASGIIFGLMAICMVWAPVNDISCFFLFMVGFRIITNTIEVPIYAFALFQLGLEGVSMLFQTMLRGDPMSSALLHISGSFWGLLAGVALLKTGRVDCEGWDVFSLMDRRKQLRKDWNARVARLERSKQNEKLPPSMRRKEDKPGLSPEERATILYPKIRQAIDVGDIAGAQASYKKWSAILGEHPPRAELLDLVKALHDRQEWVASVPLMRAICKLYPGKSAKIRLKLASILVKNCERPTEALRHLNYLEDDDLDEALVQYRQRLVEQASAMVEDGVLEMEEE